MKKLLYTSLIFGALFNLTALAAHHTSYRNPPCNHESLEDARRAAEQ